MKKQKLRQEIKLSQKMIELRGAIEAFLKDYFDFKIDQFKLQPVRVNSMYHSIMRRQQGVTMIELLSVVGVIGLLAALGLGNLIEYRYNARYAIVNQALKDAHTTSASAYARDTNLASFGVVEQLAQGSMQNGAVASLLEGYNNPSDSKTTVEYDSSCQDSGCQALFLQVAHCKGKEYGQLFQFGDGSYLRLEHIDGAGCP